MPDQTLDLMLKAARAAAAAIMEVYLDEFDVDRRSSMARPVTIADQRAEKAILAVLEPTGIPFLAEESVAAGRVPSSGTASSASIRSTAPRNSSSATASSPSTSRSSSMAGRPPA